jgi:hypothetical protein
MARYNRFVFLVSKDERKAIAQLARRLQRKEADAVRFVVLEAARALESDTQAPATSTAQTMAAQHGD